MKTSHLNRKVELSAAVRSLLFWVTAQHCWVVSYHVLGTVYWSHLQGSRPLQLGAIGCLKMSVTYYKPTLHSIPVEWTRHLPCGLWKPGITQSSAVLPSVTVRRNVFMHAMKTYGGSRFITTLILNLSARWKWVVNFMLWLLYPPGTHLIGSWVGPRQAACFRDEKNLFLCQDFYICKTCSNFLSEIYNDIPWWWLNNG